MKLSFIFCLLFLIFSPLLNAQKRADSLHFQFYSDIYYSTEPSAWNVDSSSPLYYNYTKRNEFNLNFTALTARYQFKKTHFNIGLQAGTFVQRNSISEPSWIKHVHECNIGWFLGKKQKWSIDLGLMPSHIGQETIIGFDLANLSRSFIAENSPYFETGIKAAYTSNSKKFYFAQLVTNGWANMYNAKLNGFPSFGQQFTIGPFKNVKICWNNFVGDLTADDSYKAFFFQDLCLLYNWKERLYLSASYNSGSTFRFMVERKPMNGSSFIIQYKVKPNLALAARYETYTDNYGVMLASYDLKGRYKALSFNSDLSLSDKVKIRFEAKEIQQNPYSMVDEVAQDKKTYKGFTAALQIKL